MDVVINNSVDIDRVARISIPHTAFWTLRDRSEGWASFAKGHRRQSFGQSLGKRIGSGLVRSESLS
jgi:hypothetical protein